MVEVKFCGMTREEDVREAQRLGAAFVGAIMTESQRRVSPEKARSLFAALDGTSVRSVCVFGDEPLETMIDSARQADCDVVQLHGRTRRPEASDRLREALGVEIWQVVRVGPDGISADDRESLEGADGVLLDTMTVSALGGTGQVFDWTAVAGDLRDLRFGRCLIVAGGLRPENVKDAIERLAPTVVDVSSGVESAPGIKDHQRMAAFMTAVRESSHSPTQ